MPTKFTLASNIGFSGGTINYQDAVKNIGNGSTNPFWEYVILSSSSTVPPDYNSYWNSFDAVASIGRSSGLSSGIDSGGSGSITLTSQGGTPVAPGNYYLWFLVDPENAAGEPAGNRANNNVVVPLTVLPSPAVSGPDLVPHDFSISSASATPGSALSVKGGIRNAGNVASSGFKYYISISSSASSAPDKNALNSVGVVPALGVYIDSGCSAGFTLPNNIAPGNYYLWIMVDPENASGEPAGNTGNNNILLPLTINAPLQNFTISCSSSSLSSGSTSGDGSYTTGALVPLVATPASGYNFVNWTENGNTVSTAANYSFTATSSRTLVANFVAIPPPFITSSTTSSGILWSNFGGYTISATGSPSSYGAGGLPSGLVVNTQSGVISGTPLQAGISAMSRK